MCKSQMSYIKREPLLQIAKELQGNNAFGSPLIVREIENAPAEDVAEVRHGKWNKDIFGFCNVCMECGAIVERTAIKNSNGKLNFCPNCGTKMDGERMENNNDS